MGLQYHSSEEVLPMPMAKAEETYDRNDLEDNLRLHPVLSRNLYSILYILIVYE